MDSPNEAAPSALALERERYIASLAHELRTPLTAVIGLLDLALDPVGVSENDVREMLKTAHDEAVSLGRVLDDFLVAARLSVNSLTVRPTDVDVDEAIRQAVAASRPPANLSVGVDVRNVECHADATHLRQILRSLLNNALRFAHSRIDISATSSGSSVVIDVANDGPPVPDSILPNIFDRFASSGVAGQSGALGLGLATARELARAMDGDLLHVSRPDGVLFRIVVPASDGAPSDRKAPVLGVVRHHEHEAHAPRAEPIVELTSVTVAGYRVGQRGALVELAAFAREWRPTLAVNTLLFLEATDSDLSGHLDAGALDRTVVELHATGPTWAALAETIHAMGGHVAAALAPIEDLMPLHPDFLLVNAADVTDNRMLTWETVAEMANALDAWTVVTGVEETRQLTAAQEARVPLAAGKLLGSEGANWPTVHDNARRALTRSPFAWDPEITMASLIRARSAENAPRVSRSNFTALASDLIVSTLRRAMARPETSRFEPVSVLSSSGEELDRIGVDRMISWAADRVT